MKKLLYLALAVTTIYSCNKKPKSSFTLSKSECYVGETVQCTNTSTDALTNKWSVDGKETSTDKDLTYTPTSVGSKAIKLQSYSKKEKKSSESIQTLVVKSPNVLFVGTYEEISLDGCGIDEITLGTYSDNQLVFNIDVMPIYANVTSPTSATIVPNPNFYSDGVESISINSGSITRNGNTIVLVLSYTYTDNSTGVTQTNTCTSTFTK